MTMTSKENRHSATNSLRKIFEDVKYRPFLSSHFDVHNYIRNIIRDEKSEENFNEIIIGLEDVNEEIKRYIAQHRDSLMSGMQDVALLAGKYQNLSSISAKLRRTVEKLKRDVGKQFFPPMPLIYMSI